ncbi:hypothetical protein SFRURICE_016225 [Spodoptera frugiperda]|nr:hypothetical protein SFRURICE_016225 [Spodoptera frugiperda]
MTEVAHRLSTSKSTDDVTNILHRTYEKARQADHLAWSEDPPFLRELYSLFPKVVTPDKSHIDYRRANQRMTSQISCIAHMKFICELTRIDNPNEQQLGRKFARHDHLAWSECTAFLRELYSLFPKGLSHSVSCIIFTEGSGNYRFLFLLLLEPEHR